MIATVTLNIAIDKRYVVDKFEFGSVNRVRECIYTAGGKGINVSRVAHIAKEDVIACGFIGGYAGKYVQSELNNIGIQTSFTKVEGESRSCINFYDQATGKQTEFLEPGVLVSPKKQTEFLNQFAEIIKPCNVVAISGSVPKGIDPSFYQKLITIAKQAGKTVLLDTSGELLLQGIKAKPDFIKPNCDEIEYLLGKKVNDINELIKYAESFYESGIKNVVVSLGKDGALLVCNEGVFKGNTPNIPVVNTVGCGDSMVAAFAVGFANNRNVIEIFQSALAISTANALREETGFFVKEDYENLINMVTIIKIK